MLLLVFPVPTLLICLCVSVCPVGLVILILSCLIDCRSVFSILLPGGPAALHVLVIPTHRVQMYGTLSGFCTA